MRLINLVIVLVSPLAVLSAPIPYAPRIDFVTMMGRRNGQPVEVPKLSSKNKEDIHAAFETAQDYLKGMKVAYERAHEYDQAIRAHRPLPSVGKEERDNFFIAFGQQSWIQPNRHNSMTAILQGLTTGTFQIYDVDPISARASHQTANGNPADDGYASTDVRLSQGSAYPTLLMPNFYGAHQDVPSPHPSPTPTERTIKRALVLIHESLHQILAKLDYYVKEGGNYRLLHWNQLQGARGARTLQEDGFNAQNDHYSDWRSEAQLGQPYRTVRDRCSNMWDSPHAWQIFGSLYAHNIYPLRRPNHTRRPPR